MSIRRAVGDEFDAWLGGALTAAAGRAAGEAQRFPPRQVQSGEGELRSRSRRFGGPRSRSCPGCSRDGYMKRLLRTEPLRRGVLCAWG